MMEALLPAHPEPADPALPAPSKLIATDFRLLLNLDQAACESLRRIELITRQSAKRPLTRNIDTVFWDTADQAIATAGLVLGLESSGRRKAQITQRVLRTYVPPKPPIRIVSPLPVTADRPDPVRLAFLPGEDPRLAGSLEPKMLVPLFGYSCKRTQWVLEWRGTQLELCLEQGSITANSGDESVIQLSITAPDGPSRAIFEFAGELAASVPFQLADMDAIERTCRRILGAAATLGFPAPLSTTMSVRDGVLAIGRSAASSLAAELSAVVESGSAASVHQTRVALRRLRSILSVFAPVLPETGRRDLALNLGALASALGEAREWDVFLSETIKPLERALGTIDGEPPPLRHIGTAAAALRNQAFQTAREHLAHRAIADLSLRLSAYFEAGFGEDIDPGMANWLDRPLSDLAIALLRKRHRKLQRMGTALTNPTLEQLHELRIEFKKLRYVVEFFAPLFAGKTVRRYLRSVKRLQELLGILNDASVTRNLVPRLAGKTREAHARAAGIIAGWTAAETARVHSQFRTAWEQFLTIKKFW